MVLGSKSKTGIGAEFLALDAFLDGIPESIADVDNAKTVFDAMIVDKELGTVASMLGRFLRWKNQIDGEDLLVGLEGEMKVPHVIRFVEMLLTKADTKLVFSVHHYVERLRKAASEVGSLPILTIACHYPLKMSEKAFEQCVNLAAAKGHVHILDWIINKYAGILFRPNVSSILSAAIPNNRKNVVIYILENDDEYYRQYSEDVDGIVEEIIENGKLDLFRYVFEEWTRRDDVLETSSPYNHYKIALYTAVAYRANDIVEYILTTEPILSHIEVSELSQALITAVSQDNLPVVELLVDNWQITLLEWNNSKLYDAIEAFSLPTVKYLLSKTTAADDMLMCFQRYLLIHAGKYGKLDILKYILDEQQPPEKRPSIHVDGDCILKHAAACDHMHVVKYLLEQRDGEKSDVHTNLILFDDDATTTYIHSIRAKVPLPPNVDFFVASTTCS